MSKKSQRKQNTRHVFSLRAKQKQCFYQKQISIKFCESPQQGNMEESPCYEGPIFNKDGNFLTSSFILNSEQSKFKAGKDTTYNQNKYHNYTEQKSQLFVPKPNSKNMYCNVCKEKYQDYLQHIIKPQHKKKIRNSQFNAYILDLEKKFRRAQVSPCKLKEKQLTRTETENLIIIDESSVEEILMSAPRKRIKMDNLGLQPRITLKKKPCVEEIGRSSQLEVQQDKIKCSWQAGWTNVCPVVPYPQQLFPQYYSYNMLAHYNPFSQIPNISSLQNYLQTYSYPIPNFNPYPFQSLSNYHQMHPAQNEANQLNN